MEVLFDLKEDCLWETEVYLPSWNAFKRNGQLNADHEISGRKTPVIYAPNGRDYCTSTAEGINRVKWVCENEKDIFDALLNTLLHMYPGWQTAYGYPNEEQKVIMPDASSIRDFRELVDLKVVYVHPVFMSGAPYVGFEFDCVWDDYMGLGILMHGTQVLEISGANLARMSFLAGKVRL